LVESCKCFATYWERQTDNAIFPINVAPSLGVITLLTNAIALSSHGWQVAVNIPVYSSKNFTWDLTATLDTKLQYRSSEGGDIPLTTAAGSTSLVLTAGRKLGKFMDTRR
jgi:hypothetical protein